MLLRSSLLMILDLLCRSLLRGLVRSFAVLLLKSGSFRWVSCTGRFLSCGVLSIEEVEDLVLTIHLLLLLCLASLLRQLLLQILILLLYSRSRQLRVAVVVVVELLELELLLHVGCAHPAQLLLKLLQVLPLQLLLGVG